MSKDIRELAQELMRTKESVFYNDSPDTTGVAYEFDDVIDLMISFRDQQSHNTISAIGNLIEAYKRETNPKREDMCQLYLLDKLLDWLKSKEQLTESKNQ